MANDVSGQAAPQEPVKLPTPSQIASIGSLGATKEFLQNSMQHVGNERSGQLSPSHTPGRGR